MTITIPARFNGPPGSGNGGFSAGLLAEHVGEPAVAVDLRSPPPLGRPLEVRPSADGGVAALDGDTVVLEARAIAGAGAEPPAAVGVAEAAAVALRSPWAEGHPFPTCFVCGPERAEGDGLLLFPGVARDGVHAAPWTPAGDLAGADGRVLRRFVWAALDCPSVAPMRQPVPAGPLVLARLTVEVRAPAVAGEPHVVGAWSLGIDGRKRRAGSVLWDAHGAVLAVASALWVELRA